ncbi:putative dTMP kinase [Helianthus annuus]|nr:putative dTMP kinase [Helianthus annuus]
MFGSSNRRDNVVGKMISTYLSNQSQFDDHTIHLLFSANRWEKRPIICRSLILLGYFGYTMRLLLRLSPNPRYIRLLILDAYGIVSRDLHYNKVSSAFMCCIFLKII